MPAIERADATSEDTMRTLPFPRRVVLAIVLASRSNWNAKPLIFSTIQRPFESVSRSNAPAVVVPTCAPNLAV